MEINHRFNVNDISGNVFVTSDLHFGHNKDFIYQARGFSSIEEHDESLVQNWNSVVSANDYVFVLGDILMGDTAKSVEYFKRLNGTIVIVRGNHDTDNKIELLCELPNVILGDYAVQIKDGKWCFNASHYATIVGNFDDEEKHRKFYALHGHTHSTDEWQYWTFKSYNVSVDAHHCTPVSLSAIKDKIKDRAGVSR